MPFASFTSCFTVSNRRSDNGFTSLHPSFNIAVSGNDPTQTHKLLQDLKSHFAIKQFDHVSLFLGIQINRTTAGFFLTQGHYAFKLLQEAGIANCKAAPTPITPASKHAATNSKPFPDAYLYRRLAGSL
ncbi:uncharacterized protein LOC110114707 [Dendrobium catenatum]|uniref:uncharacterized protein LOC110114435 n=1 Tax=Dendrobium catenatum TaxID=906689 RepID=UPI0009F27C5D|nr:uncharacterized protein LOC110114435 [Dendrobium catenatum]XP_020703320.1 uncharacterized protein LOC110114707 [Dendrobium catenatum]